MPSIFLSHNPQFNSLSEIVALCRDDGFGIEMAAFSDIDNVNDATQIGLHHTAITDISGKSVHGPYLELYPGNPDAGMRKKTFDCFERVYEISSSLNAGHIIFHHNYDPAACTESEWLKYSCGFWQKYLEGKSSGIKIHLENILDKSSELISELVRRINSPLLDIALDIGHAHTYSKMPLSDWVESLRARIGYVHLHDNHGIEDEHLALGKGNIPLSETLDALLCYSPDATWSLESGGTRMHHSIEWLRENGYIMNH
jgi:sugar phosphate isomerase/epimerase